MPPAQRANPVQKVENVQEALEVDKFVAVYLSNWDKVPVIGKVLSIGEEDLQIHYWKGTYKGSWEPQNVPRRQMPWTDVLPKDCCILGGFDLSDDMKLQPTTRKFLSQEYKRLKAAEGQ